MLDNAIILSIQPKYFQLILSGKKTVELRKQLPQKLEKGVLVLLYVTSPVKALSGAFVVEDIRKLPLDDLWHQVKSRLGMPRKDFNNYYSGSTHGVAISFTKAWKLQKPFELVDLREDLDEFIPPQSFRYVKEAEGRYFVRAANSIHSGRRNRKMIKRVGE